MLSIDIVRFRARFVAGAVLLTAVTSLTAHEGGHPGQLPEPSSSRTWTLPGEALRIHGRFVAASEDRVQIRGKDAAFTSVLVSRLAVSDQAWVVE